VYRVWGRREQLVPQQSVDGLLVELLGISQTVRERPSTKGRNAVGSRSGTGGIAENPRPQMQFYTCLQLYRARLIRPFFRAGLERKLILAAKTGDNQQNITLLVAALGTEADVRVSRTLLILLRAFSEEELTANAGFKSVLARGPMQQCSPHELLDISQSVLRSCLRV